MPARLEVERRWYKIGETASLVGASPKELRYWEQVIPEIRPRRSKGNLRYYHADDLPKLKRIREGLREGLAVADCRALLRESESPETSPQLPKEAELVPVVKALKILLARLEAPWTPMVAEASTPATEPLPLPFDPPPEHVEPAIPEPRKKRPKAPARKSLGPMWTAPLLPMDWEE